MGSESDIIIIGGGASGLVAGIAAARMGQTVTILEHKERIGKKILATGNGKCNFTNQNQGLENYRGDSPEFAKEVLKQFGVEETLLFFRELGIYPKNKNGYYYPHSEQSDSVLEVLRLELSHLKVKIKCNEHVVKMKKEEVFCVMTATYSYFAKKVILAAGGCASGEHGSDGSGYLLAKQLGHHISDPVPALSALRSDASFFKDLAGVRVEVVIKLYEKSRLLCCERGELQLTNYGISGIPVFQLSRFAAKTLKQGKKVVASLDFMPDMSRNELRELIYQRCNLCKYKTIEEQFIGLLNPKLAVVIIKEAGLKPKTMSDELTGQQLELMIGSMKDFRVNINEPNSFANAQVTAGGIKTGEINNHSMESKLVPGLYFSGEVIDIDGACGGYNLQWAWSTGYIAGIHAAAGKDE